MLTRNALRDSKSVRIGLFVIFLISVAALFPRSKISSLNYEAGAAWYHSDLVAPFPFAVFKEKTEFEREKVQARNAALPVFRRQETDFGNESFVKLTQEIQKLVVASHQKPADSAALAPIQTRWISFTPAETKFLHDDYARRKNANELTRISNTVFPILTSLFSDGIISQPKPQLALPQFVVRSLNDREEKVMNIGAVRDSSEARAALAQLLVAQLGRSQAFVASDTFRVAMKLGLAFLTPNIIYDAAQTNADRERAETGVPIGEGVIRQGEKIISRGEIITSDVKRKLDSFIQAKAEREMPTGALRLYLGKILIILIVIGVFTTYLYIARPKIFRDNAMVLLLILIALIELLAVWYSLQFEELSPYIVPIGLASILFTIIFDSRVGFFATVTIALLAGTIRGNDFPFTLATIFAGSLGVFFTRGILKRSQVMRSALMVFLGYAVSILAFNFSRLAGLNEILNDLLYALVSSVLCFLVYPLLYLIEKSFGITTDMTLMELADVNHPLLREMATKASGTYHHTMQVSLLSEEAATAIGANPLFCRVGAYYHDIGKVPSSEFFTENQNGENPHDAISAVTSGRIIGEHVIKGIEIGRKHKLPEEVIDFIPQHHGTTVIHFFYDKALQVLPAEQVNINDFRYPGPKPRTREAGIVMLADGVEASVRSLTIRNEETISKIIDIVIRKRLDEDQFSECPLTFADLQTIKASFINTLMASQHKRIKYPGQKL
jgi:cyclic-di-AMP phosphodiesterase PgpH